MTHANAATVSMVLLNSDPTTISVSPRRTSVCQDLTEVSSVEDVSNRESSELSFWSKSKPSKEPSKPPRNDVLTLFKSTIAEHHNIHQWQQCLFSRFSLVLPRVKTWGRGWFGLTPDATDGRTSYRNELFVAYFLYRMWEALLKSWIDMNLLLIFGRLSWNWPIKRKLRWFFSWITLPVQTSPLFHVQGQILTPKERRQLPHGHAIALIWPNFIIP